MRDAHGSFRATVALNGLQGDMGLAEIEFTGGAFPSMLAAEDSACTAALDHLLHHASHVQSANQHIAMLHFKVDLSDVISSWVL